MTLASAFPPPVSARPRRTALYACLLLAVTMLGAGVQTANADDEDHERARHAVEADKVRPLAEILSKVRPSLPGRIIGTEFEEEHGRYVYEFKVISPSGRVREIYVDAASGAILSEEDD
ncbi:PepSY domain-containing protein [Roseibium litorale]|uniref:PepSY domain-containing protein n=1 Tax=Roseibium litorale TaxID=2803841 RepID=A0ABR9CTD2_9HYPH|nr:PepSY domain-containing protein [Roseibium litorale]MBD8893547.1 PepSY domain-containing protein [Roseibium litorale]